MFVSLAVMAFQLLFAQSFTVKGKVIAEEGNEPLIGVAIMQGTNNGVITDIDGNYSIEIKRRCAGYFGVLVHWYAAATARSDSTDTKAGYHVEE